LTVINKCIFDNYFFFSDAHFFFEVICCLHIFTFSFLSEAAWVTNLMHVELGWTFFFIWEMGFSSFGGGWRGKGREGRGGQ